MIRDGRAGSSSTATPDEIRIRSGDGLPRGSPRQALRPARSTRDPPRTLPPHPRAAARRVARAGSRLRIHPPILRSNEMKAYLLRVAGAVELVCKGVDWILELVFETIIGGIFHFIGHVIVAVFGVLFSFISGFLVIAWYLFLVAFALSFVAMVFKLGGLF